MASASISSLEGPFYSKQCLAPVWVTWGISSPCTSNLYLALINSCYRGRGIWHVINTDDDSYGLLMDEAVNWIASVPNILPATTDYLISAYVPVSRLLTTISWVH